MITKENIIEILKQFEQQDFKNGGVSIAPERYEGIASKLLEKIFGGEDDPKNSIDYLNYLQYLHDTNQTQEICSYLTWIEDGKQMLEI